VPDPRRPLPEIPAPASRRSGVTPSIASTPLRLHDQQSAVRFDETAVSVALAVIGIRTLTASEYVASGQSDAAGTETTATVTAFDLGVCQGKLMYQEIEWYFPQYGQQFNPNSYINICTGDYHNM
jgi:hypothetical protein